MLFRSTFLHLGFHQIEVLTEAFRRAVLREFVRRDLLDAHVAQSMLAWEHSGFHIHHAVRLEADDACGILQLARYAARAPVALERMQYDARKQRVRIVSDKSEGPTAGTHEFDALEFLARLLTHVPDKSSIYVRYYGAYSVRTRARWRKDGILPERRLPVEDAPHDGAPTWPEMQARRRRWAELLQRIFEVEPLPEQSALWSLPNVIVTPHSSGTNPGNGERAAEIFFDNLRIPADSLVGEEGKGFRYILDGMNAERILIAAEALGDAGYFVDRATQIGRAHV